MMDERAALVILEGEISENALIGGCQQELQRAVKSFANQSLKFFEQGKHARFKQNLSIAIEFLTLGNDQVKDAILNVYLETLANAFERHNDLAPVVKKALPRQYKAEYDQYYRSCA